MKKSRLFLFTSLTATLVACGQSDYESKAYKSYFSAPPESGQCNPKATNSVMTVFEARGHKLQIEENKFGIDSEIATLGGVDPVVKAGKELVFATSEKCEGAGRSELVVLKKNTTVSELEAQIDNDECVVGVGENVMMYPTAAPNDPQYSSQTHHTNIKAEAGWAKFFDATNGIKDDVLIAIIDSGVDTDHEDLVDNMWKNTGEVAGNRIDDDNDGYIDDVYGYNFASGIGDPNPQPWTGQNAGAETHGTHVAGLSAAKMNNGKGVVGVNGSKVKIMALNVFGSSPGASTPNIDNAIRYAADHGASVINMSLGGRGQASTTGAAISYAINKGVVVIAAAGNDNLNIQTTWFTPASYGQQYQGMLAIGAIDAASSAKCGFSNYSSTYVEMAAPGCQAGTQGLLSTFINSYGRMQGTSMASPVAAGVASLAYGLVWARKGSKPAPSEIEDIMKAGARVESGLSTYFMGGKTVDLDSLYTEINKRYPAGGAAPTPTPNPSPTPGPCGN